MNDILVVYYSRTGKTRLVAEKLAGLLGADVEEITEEKNRSGVLGYLVAGKDALLKRRAELTRVPSVDGREAVVIGMPVWGFRPPPAIRAYVETVDLSGKAVCAFCTYDGSGGDRTLEAMREMLPSGLAERFAWKRPRADDPVLDQRLAEWADRIKETC